MMCRFNNNLELVSTVTTGSGQSDSLTDLDTNQILGENLSRQIFSFPVLIPSSFTKDLLDALIEVFYILI